MGQLETSHIVLGMMLIGLHRKVLPWSGLQEECFNKELTKKRILIREPFWKLHLQSWKFPKMSTRENLKIIVLLNSVCHSLQATTLISFGNEISMYCLNWYDCQRSTSDQNCCHHAVPIPLSWIYVLTKTTNWRFGCSALIGWYHSGI